MVHLPGIRRPSPFLLPAHRRWLMLCAGLGFAGLRAAAQPALPPEAIEQFERVIGRRVEALTILGGDYAAAGGIYTFRGGNLADVSISKLGGGGEVAALRPLGDGQLRWAPVLKGNLGLSTAENEFAGGYLQGNRSVYDLLAVQAGGGVRVYFNEHLSVSPTVSGIYGRTENEFKPQNAVGDFVKAVASGTYVDWQVETWSVVPYLDVQYEWLWGRSTFQFISRYNYFHTESFNSSSPVISVDGNSHTWENKLAVDVPLGTRLFERELRTGGFFSRTDVTGSAAEGLNENQVYTVNGRFVLDVLGAAWKVRWVGIGCSYFWGENFTGWTAGIDLSLQF